MILLVVGMILLQRAQCHTDVHSRSQRSVGGSSSSIEDHPYMASLRLNGGHICGGSILSESIILTAGHCILPDVSLDSLSVKVGDADINYKGSWHKIAQIVRHERFQLSKNIHGDLPFNDVALLKLENPIAIDNVTSRKVQLFGEDEKVQDYDTGTLVGWGHIPPVIRDLDKTDKSSRVAEKITAHYPSNLKGVELNIATKNKCHELFPGTDLQGQFCTYTLGRAACSGDSGGPLMVDGRQAGIVSWIEPICLPTKTSTYFVEVAQFRKWIDEHMKVLVG